MSRVITGQLFVIRCAIGRTPQPPLLIEAESDTEADNAALLHFAEQGEEREIRILSMTVVDLESL